MERWGKDKKSREGGRRELYIHMHISMAIYHTTHRHRV